MNDLVVSEYTDEHAGELVRLWRAAFEHGVGVVDPHPLDEQLAYFRETVQPNHRVRLAWDRGALVGFIAANDESVAQLHVRVDRHRRGIGSYLLSLAKRDCAGSLWLYTFERNLVARRFYERHGFTAIASGFEPTWQLADVRYRWVREEGVI